MKTGKSIIWGIVLVVLGFALCLSALDLIDFDLFFDGWWTLFIIIPSFISLFTEDNKTTSTIFLIVGILLLLACQDIIDFSLMGRLIAPIIIIIVGLSLLFKTAFNTSINKSIASINSTSKAKEEYTAVFAGQDVKLDNEEFHGTSINAVFGGVKLDLRNAVIKEDVVINGRAVFGEIDIYTPDNVNVQIKSNSVFGGVDNKNKNNDKKITIYIDATCVFGGIDIK